MQRIKIYCCRTNEFTSDLFNFITPAFENVADEVNLNDIKNAKPNPFCEEYSKATSQLILKRFGYTITNTQEKTIKTPPFGLI